MSTTNALGIALVVLKLTDQIQWAWFWVLLPFWGPFVLAIVLIAILEVVTVILEMVK